jgi:hypothetical protein
MSLKGRFTDFLGHPLFCRKIFVRNSTQTFGNNLQNSDEFANILHDIFEWNLRSFKKGIVEIMR